VRSAWYGRWRDNTKRAPSHSVQPFTRTFSWLFFSVFLAQRSILQSARFTHFFFGLVEKKETRNFFLSFFLSCVLVTFFLAKIQSNTTHHHKNKTTRPALTSLVSLSFTSLHLTSKTSLFPSIHPSQQQTKREI
jgi:hypothetical protein